MSILQKLIFFIAVILILPSCAAVGSIKYYAVETTKGDVNWDAYQLKHGSSKPDNVTYSQKDFKLALYINRLEDNIYLIGPCILIPLPIIPLFGLADTKYDGPVRITFSTYESPSTYQLTKANIVVDNKLMSPISMKSFQSADHKQVNENPSFPLSFTKNTKTYFMTYDMQAAKTASFDLEFTIVDESGTVFLEDRISYKHETSSYWGCVM